jgi:hypothetical protein
VEKSCKRARGQRPRRRPAQWAHAARRAVPMRSARGPSSIGGGRSIATAWSTPGGSTGHPGSMGHRFIPACDADRSAAATVRIGGLLARRAGLLAAMPRRAQMRPGGVVTPAILQSGGEPEGVRASRQPGGFWPGGYELRRSSRAGDFLVADALRLETAEEARRYLQEIQAPACSGAALASQTARPQHARNLVSRALPGTRRTPSTWSAARSSTGSSTTVQGRPGRSRPVSNR